MLIHNAKLVTWGQPNEIFDDSGVFVSDGLIADKGASSDLLERYPNEERIDAAGQYVMPGNVCAHTHFYGAFARGMAIPGNPPKDFPDILRKLWWPLDQALTLEDIQYSALVCLVDAIKHGTTTLIDHHASPNAIPGSLDVIATAVEKSGLRAALCYEVTDRGGDEKAIAGIDENLRFLKRLQSHALSDVRFHVAEHEADQEDSLEKSKQRVIKRLNSFGILGEKTIVAHAVHVDDREVELLKETRTWVTHQPRSNMNNAVGAANVDSMMRSGVRLGLGNDGFANAMWEEWKTAYLLHKHANRDPRRLPGDKLIEMAVTNNAGLATELFAHAPIGVLEKGACADLIFVDYHPTTPLSSGNLPWHMVFGFHESMITATIVAGQMLMKDRVLLTLDEERITARSRELAEDVWLRYQSYVPKD
jgi:cytosine/adenosine deaminase-related metal-dependent hydrolase